MSPFVAEEDAKQYLKLCESILDDSINMSPITEIRNSILADPSQMHLYGEKSYQDLLTRYKKKLYQIKSILSSKDKETHILNILEYLKYTCAGEDYIGIPDVLFFESIDNYPYSSLLIGKGTSSSQIRLLKEFIKGEEYKLVEVQRQDPNNEHTPLEKFYVLLKGDKFIDPYHYNGKRKQNRAFYFSVPVSEEEYSEKKRKKAKEKVTDFLIGELKIREKSNEILRDLTKNQDKVTKIIDFITKNYKDFHLPVRYYIVEIEGKRIEVSRLLELFLIANGIEYTQEDQTNKENTIFNVNGIEIDISGIISREKSKEYIKKYH